MLAGSVAPPPPSGFDRFGSSNLVRFVETGQQPLLGSFRIVGPNDAELGRLRRDGLGWRVVQLNFSLENPEGRAVYRIRMPSPPHPIGSHPPFTLQDPFGTPIGKLSWRFPGRASLHLFQGSTYSARVAGPNSPFPFEAPGRTLAEATYVPARLFRAPVHPPGLELRFTPACGGAGERSVVVAFAAFVVSMARPGRESVGAGP
jgi:hypothetical protein